MARAIFDFDWLKYTCAAVGETRTILVTHKASGREMEFKNRTEFYGRNKKGGWLEQRNINRTSPFEVSEFEITDIQKPKDISHSLHTVKTSVDRALRIAGTSDFHGFLGEGDSFRVELSTVLEYKGNRKELIRPVHLDAVAEYIEKKYKAEIVTGLEADDHCVIECHENDNILVGVDKDYYGCHVNYLNMNQELITNGNQFGEIHLNTKGDVKGFGDMFFYFQVASGDAIDNYKANSASKVSWADKSAYKALKDVKGTREAAIKLKEIYQNLYRKPVVVKGWKGEDIEVDWLYMLTENWNMARMMTSLDDRIWTMKEMEYWLN